MYQYADISCSVKTWFLKNISVCPIRSGGRKKKGTCQVILKLQKEWKLIHLPSVYIITYLSVHIMLLIQFEACPRVTGLYFMYILRTCTTRGNPSSLPFF